MILKDQVSSILKRKISQILGQDGREPSKGKNEEEKVAIFMCTIGRHGQDIKETFEFQFDEGSGEEIVTVESLFQKFEEYCWLQKNLVVERHWFLTRNQGPSETVDQYVTKLKTLAATCDWGNWKMISSAVELWVEFYQQELEKDFFGSPIKRWRKQ